ncbi:MAG: isocitrate lyase/phosphoenolpyruvate mutase family protein [Sphingobacteriales bacterium]|nr:isocitrate lyase/phosphoenolpyruvate mutase family protein [Sphingobacteriales bacterium]
MTQKEKAIVFNQLHHNDKLLVLPNIWDPLGALLLESSGYPAVATASAAVAFSNGFDDGEIIPFENVLGILKKITAAVGIPVTADIESGYADNDAELYHNVQRLIGTGIVGVNIEDTDSKTKHFFPVEIQCQRINTIRKAADEMGVPIFINARTDVFLHGETFSTPQQKLDETVARGLAYKKAGADCLFPIAMKQQEDIQKLISSVQMPVNILAIPGVPALYTLNEIGVARVSLGSSFLKIAIRAMKTLALELKNSEGLSSITENEITTDILKKLVNKN